LELTGHIVFYWNKTKSFDRLKKRKTSSPFCFGFRQWAETTKPRVIKSPPSSTISIFFLAQSRKILTKLILVLFDGTVSG